MAGSATIFEARDLNQRGWAMLDAARAGEARVRDQDGLSLLVLPEQRVRALTAVVQAAINLAALELALASTSHQRSLHEYGEWTWLRSFDDEDLREFVREMRETLIVAGREEAPDKLEETLYSWRATAQALDDPVGRSVLLGEQHPEDFVEVGRPE